MADIKQIILPDGNTYNLKDTVSNWVGTQEEYDAIVNKDPNITYYITDAPSMTGTAKELSYNGGVGSTYDEVENKLDKVATGTYNFSGIWSPSFYASRSMFIPFANANDYTVTLVRARYASDNTTMNDITSTAQIPTGGITEVGIQVTTTTNCDLKYGDVQLKFE